MPHVNSPYWRHDLTRHVYSFLQVWQEFESYFGPSNGDEPSTSGSGGPAAPSATLVTSPSPSASAINPSNAEAMSPSGPSLQGIENVDINHFRTTTYRLV